MTFMDFLQKDTCFILSDIKLNETLAVANCNEIMCVLFLLRFMSFLFFFPPKSFTHHSSSVRKHKLKIPTSYLSLKIAGGKSPLSLRFYGIILLFTKSHFTLQLSPQEINFVSKCSPTHYGNTLLTCLLQFMITTNHMQHVTLQNNAQIM